MDVSFFEENGYRVSFPKGDLIDRLKAKARVGSLSNQDYAALGTFMAEEVYRRSDYQAGNENVRKVLPQLDQMLAELARENYEWQFRTYERYRILLTLYGPGGSYDPVDGTIILFTTSQGAFRQYESPVNTLIHEVVHLGIEASIVQKLQVPHDLKERIVDTIVMRHFGEDLPDYRIQQMGDPSIDGRLATKDSLHRLPRIVGAFLEPRS